MSTALIDANNFYASCEQMIDPSLTGRPIVVLSNNDGCVIARNAEARCLGIPMGQPYFKVRYLLEKFKVQVRSSNYTLYGDISQRLMKLLKTYCDELEVYSIDEAFVEIKRPSNKSLLPWARHLRALVYQNLGVAIAIGIGKNKCQAKLANHLAKREKNHAGIFDLEVTENMEYWLESVAIEDVWGIGPKLSYWCRIQGVRNARQLRDMPSNKLKAKYGVVGIRLQKELQGKLCIPISIGTLPKKETCVSRSFNSPVTNLEDLRQAIAMYVVRASEKLRKQKQRAGAITIFTSSSPYKPFPYSQAATQKLNIPSNDTALLLKAALLLTEKIFQSNCSLVKAGVIMQKLQSDDQLQLHLFESEKIKDMSRRERLLKTIDNLNTKYGSQTIKWAASGVNQPWLMRREALSPAATTQLTKIPIVRA